MEPFRHYSRSVVNLLALMAAVLALPEFGGVVPTEQLPLVGSFAAVLNTILSLSPPPQAD